MTEEKKPLPHEVLIGFAKQAQNDFRDLVSTLKDLNEGVQAVVIMMSGGIEENKEEPPKVEEEDEEEIEGIEG